MLVRLVGTSHRYQVWSDAIRAGRFAYANARELEAFERFISDACRLHRVSVLAEEMNECAVVARTGGASVAKLVADRLEIQHLFCDPAFGQRESFDGCAVLSTQYGSDQVRRYEKIAERTHLPAWHVAARELWWLGRLRKLPSATTILFICGADHIDTFFALLKSHDIEAEIYERDWVPVPVA